jgi:anti-sigma-K factor RskA
MNQEKAREYFSAYYEGNLERGLRQTMEQRLRSDAQLNAEYRAFQRTMDELDNLRFEEIEVPSYLSDRIATRIEEARAANKRKNPFLLWLPRYAVAGLAAVALLGASVAIFTSYQAKPSASSTIPTMNVSTPPPSETISVTGTAQHVVLHYQSAIARSVQVLDATGHTLKTYPLQASQPLNTNLDNPNDNAALFEVKVSDGGPDQFVAVPGKSKGASSSDSGSIGDFASALADTYQSPVIIKAPLSSTVSWSIDGQNEVQEAQKALGSGYDVTLSGPDGVISIAPK